MKWVFIFSFIFFKNLFALEIDYYSEISREGFYQNTSRISCQSHEEKLCNEMCGDSQVCYREEMTCTSCAGRQDYLLRVLFTRAELAFYPTGKSWRTPDLAAYLFSRYYVLLSFRSVYNFHKEWASSEVLKSFQTFCPYPTLDPLLIVSLDDRNRPEKFEGVICRDIDQQSYVESVNSKFNFVEFNKKYDESN